MRRIFNMLFPIVFVVAGCFCIFLGVKNIQNRAVYSQTNGVISKIEEVYVGGEDNEYDYEVTVKYTVDGKEYSTLLGEYDIKMKEGQEIGIFYDPKDPNKIMSDSNTTPVVLITLGIVGALAGVYVFIKGLR